MQEQEVPQVATNQPTYETLRKGWNENAEFYSKKMEINTLPAAIQLWGLLGRPQYSTLLDAGCGSGRFLNYLIKEANTECSIICSDISENMIKLASKNTKVLIEEKRRSIPIDVTFKVCPNEELTDISSDSIDTYVSNLTLHLVIDANMMLKEAKRVLKSGGKLGLSVSLYEGNLLATISEILRTVPGLGNFGPRPGVKPFQFDRESFIRIVEENDFNVRFCYQTFIGYPDYTDEDYLSILNFPDIKKALNSLPTAIQEKVIKDYLNCVEKFRKERHTPGINFLLLAAIKP